MARRKKAGLSGEAIVWRVALYIRLSREDGSAESLSVANQKALLLEYLDKSFVGEYELAGIYIDDGQTGTDSNRESFKRLLDDIDARRVNCVIVKDPSRLSRNYSEAGHYMEVLFVKMDVRFISLGLPQVDSYLQPEQMNSIAMPIQNVINDDFCRQTSLKVRGVFDHKRRNGQFIGAFAPYGFQKDPNNKNRLIIDDEAARTVRDIFDWFVREGMSKLGIAKRLSSRGVPNPAAYKRQKGLRYSNPSVAKGLAPAWSPKTVSDILRNQVYIGHMVQGRQQVKSYKVHTRVAKDESEWFVCENTHEPIIDAETFEKAQSLNRRDTRTPNGKSEIYPLSGFVRCAGCGRAMQRSSAGGIIYYVCRSNRESGACTRHSVRYSVLEDAILSAINAQIQAVEPVDEIISAVRDMPRVRGAAPLDTLLSEREDERAAVLRIRDALYTDLKTGLIAQDEYRRIKQSYTEQLGRLDEAVARIRAERSGTDIAGTHALCRFDERREIAAVDRNLVVTMLDAVYVYEKSGEKLPGIELVFNYADPFGLMS